jgi:hypothetical protein
MFFLLFLLVDGRTWIQIRILKVQKQTDPTDPDHNTYFELAYFLTPVQCPESGKREEKIEDINLLFIHMHHLINEFRPHQVLEHPCMYTVQCMYVVYVTFCLV